MEKEAGWTVEIMRKSDTDPRSYGIGDLRALAAVGDLVSFELGQTSWATVIQRRFDYEKKAVRLLVEPIRE